MSYAANLSATRQNVSVFFFFKLNSLIEIFAAVATGACCSSCGRTRSSKMDSLWFVFVCFFPSPVSVYLQIGKCHHHWTHSEIANLNGWSMAWKTENWCCCYYWQVCTQHIWPKCSWKQHKPHTDTHAIPAHYFIFRIVFRAYYSGIEWTDAANKWTWRIATFFLIALECHIL